VTLTRRRGEISRIPRNASERGVHQKNGKKKSQTHGRPVYTAGEPQLGDNLGQDPFVKKIFGKSYQQKETKTKVVHESARGLANPKNREQVMGVGLAVFVNRQR